MATENWDRWEEPLPSEPSTPKEEEEEEASDPEADRRVANLEKLQRYVNRMAYKPVPPPKVRPRSDKLAQPKKRVLIDVFDQYGDIQDPRERKQRMKLLLGQAITAEQVEELIKAQRVQEGKKRDLEKLKQALFATMLSKLEKQCREQYLNVLVNKFSKFVANLATTMNIPQVLCEPYGRMQRGLFCNILLAIGVTPYDNRAIYYTCQEAIEYEVCHKLAHALLSLIIKALDAASTRKPGEQGMSMQQDLDMDNYIRERLMCAAEKKVLNIQNNSKNAASALARAHKKCKL